jgi:DNA/RNA-binding domain of Phe-tRNA-synthetase-like protein
MVPWRTVSRPVRVTGSTRTTLLVAGSTKRLRTKAVLELTTTVVEKLLQM